MSICLGIDMSTQSCSAVVVDSEAASILWQDSIPYLELADQYGLHPTTLTLRGMPRGAFEQPPLLFVECLDRLFFHLKEAGLTAGIDAIALSAQQHGHVYLTADFERSPIFTKATTRAPTELLPDCFAYPHSPIWMTSNTRRQARAIRAALGGSVRALEIAAADVPLRFTGVIVRRVAQDRPRVYRATWCIHLISSFLTALLSANPRHPIDYGNACGMLLMDYRQRRWSDELLAAVATDLPDGKEGLRAKLPSLASAYLAPQCLGEYWIHRHGFSSNCLVAGGGGDNPHTKSLVKGDLLSLGTSFVHMQETAIKQPTPVGANGMYDGLDRPFYFFPRTNGSLVWNQARGKLNYAQAEEILNQAPIGARFAIWQPLPESFPVSPAIAPVAKTGDAQIDYPALVDTVLALLYVWCHGCTTRAPDDPLYVTGGAANSRAVLERLSALWQRPVYQIGAAGAALGAAVAACAALSNQTEGEHLARALVTETKQVVASPAKMKRAAHFLPQVQERYAQFITQAKTGV